MGFLEVFKEKGGFRLISLFQQAQTSWQSRSLSQD